MFYFVFWVGKDVIEVDDENDLEKFVCIYSLSIDEEGEYGDFELFGLEINCFGYYFVNVLFLLDGCWMFFNCILVMGNVLMESKIYLSEGSDGNWKSVNEVVGVNGDYLVMQFVVGEFYGKEVLFFVFNMDGGEGGYDIYYVMYQGEGVYGDLVNLGLSINIL